MLQEGPKKYIARKIMFTYGRLNGDIKLFLVVALAIKQVHTYSLIIIWIYKSTKHAQTLTVALSLMT